MTDIHDLVRKIHEAKVSRQIAHRARQMAYEDGMLDIVAEYDKVIARWDKILQSIEHPADTRAPQNGGGE